jgi:hypothetical protein
VLAQDDGASAMWALRSFGVWMAIKAVSLPKSTTEQD